MLKPTDLGLSREDVELIVTRYLASEKVQPIIRNTWIESFGGNPDGFLADHFDLKIQINLSGRRTEELSFFLKVVPAGKPILAQYLIDIDTFKKEVRICENVLPKIQEQIADKQIVPRYLLTKEDRMIVMENVKLKGFDILKDNKGMMNAEQLEKALEALAYLHAGSVVLEEREGRRLTEMFPGALKENAWTGIKGSIRTRDVENVVVLWCEFMRIVERDSAKLEKILAELPGTIRSIYDYVKPSKTWRNVFGHGDLWSNNVMFRNSSDGVPLECILVDFQLSRYTPPGYDISLLLSLTTSGKFRSERMSSLLDSYYRTFEQIMEQSKIDPTSIYTKESFLDSCKYYRLAGQIHGCIIGPEVLLPESYLDEVFVCSEEHAGFMPQPKINICLQAFRSDVEFRERMLDIVQELLPGYAGPI
ncbi:uncharacterized protein LOC131679230 [Topomyia yanbarensis]|uniref:uncharacterized protein LOC131679230 n=1 Tax=Topomyia yanbarensis TaxID=2498891 RepID=UPI00273BE48A|nr:uncharacterized protein LOC131679230 [Topomyia yanbarensis]